MREPPVDLADDALGAALRTHYALTVRTLTFLPLGHDSSAWVYRVQADDEASYFLKMRTSMANAPSLLVPRYLHEHGVTQVVAPLPTVTGALWAALAGYVLILYPFIEGTTGMAQGMASEQWTAYGTILRQIHDMAVVSQLAHPMRRETFVPTGAATVREVDGHIGQRSFDDPIAQTLTALWRDQRNLIHTLVVRAEDLGRQVAQKALPFVLCHADIHTDNVLLAADGHVWIVDWDETLLAPKERDLMFVAGGGISRELVGLREEAQFLRGYGATSLDSLALSYYRYAWAVSDIGEYGAQIVTRPDLGEVSRQAGVAFLPLTLVMFTTVRVVPRLLSRYGPKPLMVAGATLVAGADIWLTRLSADSGYASGLIGRMVLLGIGIGCSIMPLQMLILSGVARHESGAASGLLQTMQQVGGSLGLAILVTMFGSASRDAATHLPSGAALLVQRHHIFAHGIASAFTIAACFATCTLLVALLAIRSRPSPTRPAAMAA